MRISAIILLLLVFPFLAVQADSSTCSEVRLDQNNGSMSKVPREPYRQYDLNHCYAVTAAQMIDAYRFSHGDTETSRYTSALDLARRYKSTIRKDSRKVIQTLTANKDYYLKTMNKEQYDATVRAYWMHNPILVKPVEAYSTDVVDFGYPHEVFTKLQKKGEIETCDYRNVDLLLPNVDSLKTMNKGWKDKQKFSDVGYPGFNCSYEQSNIVKLTRAFNEAAVKTNYEEFFGEMLEKSCEGAKLSVKLPEPSVFRINTASDQVDSSRRIIAKRMRVAFDLQNPQPVALSYCMEVLSGKPGSFPSKCEFAHASVIIGRRPGKAGKCEYLLRNSTPQCYFQKENCKDGEHWMEEDTLLSGTIDMSVIVDESAKMDFERRAAN